jgi:3'(2'), 5'-bisphosphate nucleotidase
MQYEKYLPGLCELLWRVSDEIMRIYEAAPQEQGLAWKADESPLTAADLRAQALIADWLAEHCAEIPLISEESQHRPYAERAKDAYCWLLDPLDGTREFVNRTGDFTINLALIEGQEAVMGLVFLPVFGQAYWALKGKGAYRQVRGQEAERIEAADFAWEDSGLLVAGSRSHFDPQTQAFVDKLHAPLFLARGSALKFTMIAEGSAQVYPRCSPTSEWDTAAAQVIVEEAGGVVLDWDTGQPLRYNKPDFRNPYFLCHGKLRKK